MANAFILQTKSICADYAKNRNALFLAAIALILIVATPLINIFKVIKYGEVLHVANTVFILGIIVCSTFSVLYGCGYYSQSNKRLLNPDFY